MILFFFKIPTKFLCLILLDRCWVVPILFVGMVEFQSYTNFLVDQFTHSDMSNLILFCANLLLSLVVVIIVIIIILWEFFTPALDDGLPLEVVWQQVSLSLQESSQNSGRSQHCCSLEGLHSSFYFQVFQTLYQSFGVCFEHTNYNWYQSLSCYILWSILSHRPLSFIFTLWSARTVKFTIWQVLSLSRSLSLSLSLSLLNITRFGPQLR